MNTTRNVIIGIIVVVLIALLAFFAWSEKQTSEVPTSTATTTTPVSSTSTGASITVGSSATSTGTYTVTPIKTGSAPSTPNYKTPLSYSAGMNAGEVSQDQSDFAAAQTTLATNPTDYTSWIELGLLREGTGDYAGAAADWNYVTELYPNDPTAFANLGDLYENYLHESSQAIVNYKEAIKLDPKQEETFYQNLAQVYINEGDTVDAKATLQQGVTAQVVGYQNLQTELNSMQ